MYLQIQKPWLPISPSATHRYDRLLGRKGFENSIRSKKGFGLEFRISDPVEDCTDERAYIIVDKKAFGPFCPAKRRKRRDFRFDSSKSFYQPVFLKSTEPTISSFPASPGPTPSKYINPSQKPELFGDSFSVSGLYSGQKHGCKFIRLFFWP